MIGNSLTLRVSNPRPVFVYCFQTGAFTVSDPSAVWLGHSSGMWTRLTGVLAAVTVQHADAKDSPGFGGSVAIDKKSNSVVQMPEVHRGYWVIYHACG